MYIDENNKWKKYNKIELKEKYNNLYIYLLSFSFFYFSLAFFFFRKYMYHFLSNRLRQAKIEIRKKNENWNDLLFDSFCYVFFVSISNVILDSWNCFINYKIIIFSGCLYWSFVFVTNIFALVPVLDYL